jgi:hypothetical protein
MAAAISSPVNLRQKQSLSPKSNLIRDTLLRNHLGNMAAMLRC